MRKQLSKSYQKSLKRLRRKKSIRKKILGSSDRPRLTVFRSLKNIYAQIVDDSIGKTLVSCSSIDKNLKLSEKMSKNEISKKVGILLGKKALSNNIKKVCFDKNGYKYHGRVKNLADGSRESGLEF